MALFTDINDALETVPDLLKSSGMTSVDNMKNASTSLNMTANLDPFVLEQGFPGHGNQFYQQMQEVQNLSDAFDECGNFAQDLIQASTEDYIKNTGIQQAGRELANTLGQYSDELDCAAGFATLFDSKEILDDVLGIGDLPQIQSRVQQIIRDVTNPAKLAQMVTNLDAVQGLLEPFNDFCTGMKDALNLLVAKDLASLNAILNKLAQWAAFTNLATSDPCALVNNNKMFSSITDPVMDDILGLYAGIIGGGPSETPINNLGDLFAPDQPSALVGGFTQAPGAITPFGSYFSELGTDIGGVATSIGGIITSAGESVSDFLGGDDDGTIVDSYTKSWNGTEWVRDEDDNVISGLESLSVGALSGNNSFNPALENFKQMKEKIEFESFLASDSLKSYSVDSCRGVASWNDKSDCIAKGGSWSKTNYTPTSGSENFDLAGELNLPSLDDITSSISSFFSSETTVDVGGTTFSGGNLEMNGLNLIENGIDNDMATEAPPGSGSDTPSNSLPAGAKAPKPHSVSRSVNRTVGVASVPSQGRTRPNTSSSRPSDGKTPFSVPKSASIVSTGAKVQSPTNTSAFENRISSFDSGTDAIKLAQKTGDFSKIESCRCVGGTGNSSDARSCVANGGSWNCQGGTSGVSVMKSIKSLGTIASAKNVELSSVLPSSAPFKGL